MAKIALLIGVSEYEPGLDGLPSAVNDVAAMQQVLTNSNMGEFTDAAVTVLSNPARQAMEDAIYNLFAHRQRDDLVLLYFSGHGVINEGGEFYFASRFTRKEQGRLVPTTATAARSVCDWMETSHSQYKVIILDSCFSGAFAKGVKAKDSGSVNPSQFLGSKGTAILTASTSTQYALTQEGLDLSIYTHYLVEGIRTGGADQDNDGFIGMDELHAYASSKVKEAAPAMTPEFYPVKEGYKIVLAKSPRDDRKLRYRKEVKRLAEEEGGEFSLINRSCLDVLQHNLKLLPDDALEIEAEELEPYRQRRAKVDRYRTVFEGAITNQYPLTERDRLGLQRLQELLSLRDEDVTEIEAPLLIPKQTEYDRQQAKQALQEREAALLREQAVLIENKHQQAEQRRQEQERTAQMSEPVAHKPPHQSEPLEQLRKEPILTSTSSQNSAYPRVIDVTAPTSKHRQPLSRQLLKWGGFGSGGLVVALIVSQISHKPEGSQPSSSKVETVLVGSRRLKLGSLLSSTGDLASVGQPMIETVSLLINNVNQCGGVNGAPVELVSADDGTDLTMGNIAMTKLVEVDRVAGVVGSFASSISRSALDVAVRNKVMLVSPGSTSPIFTELAKKGDFKGYWARTASSDIYQARSLAKLARDKGLKRVATVVINNDYGVGFEKEFVTTFKALGGSVTNEKNPTRYDPRATTLNTEAKAAFKDKPDGVAVVVYAETGGLLLKAAYEAGLTKGVKLLLTDGVKSDDFASYVGKTKDGKFIIAGAIGTAPGADGKALAALTQLWKAKKNSPPPAYVPQSWDAAALLVLAAQAAKANTGEAIASKIREVSSGPGEEVMDVCKGLELLKAGKTINYQGASGNVDIDANGDVVGVYDVWQIENNGKTAIIGKVKLQ